MISGADSSNPGRGPFPAVPCLFWLKNSRGKMAPRRVVDAAKPLSGLQKRIDQLLHFLKRHGARVHLAIDEEGGRRADPKLFLGAVAHPLDPIEDLLVGEALFEALVREPGLLDRR